jgi:hypothetical protein
MLADLDLLLTAVLCTADDLLPEGKKNARRRLTDAEVVTLCVAQSIMGIGSDERFARIAPKRLGHLFAALTKRSGFHKRRERLTETIEAMSATLASQSPAGTTTCCSSTPPRLSAPAPGRRSSAPVPTALAGRSQTPPTTATAPLTVATSGAFACTR